MARIVSIIVSLTLVLSTRLLAQPEPPYGVSQLAGDAAVLVYWFYPHVNDSMLALIDAEPDSYCLYSSEEIGARLATLFDLPAGPCAIEAIELRLWPLDPFPQYAGDQFSPFRLSLQSTLSADPAAMSLWESDVRRTGQEINEWLHIWVGESIESDSIAMIFHWSAGSPTAPLPAIVYRESYLNNYDGHVEHGIVVWRKMYDSAVLARIVISLPDISTVQVNSPELPDSFSVFIFDSPSQEGSATPQILTISDSLHVSIARTAAAGKYLAVAAWKGGVLSTKSEIIRLDVTTEVAESPSPMPVMGLVQNYPNPFNAETVIQSSTSEDVYVLDLLGRVVARKRFDSRTTDGCYQFHWDGRDDTGNLLPSGVYFYRQAGSPGVRKMVLLK